MNNVTPIHTIIQRFFSNANENSFAQLANNWSDTLPYAHRDRDLPMKLRRSTAYLLLYKSAIPIVCLRASTQPRKALLASGSEGTWEWHTKQQSSNPRSAHKVAMKPLIVCGKSARICSPQPSQTVPIYAELYRITALNIWQNGVPIPNAHKGRSASSQAFNC